MDKYWSEEIVQLLVKNSNAYIDLRKKNDPNAKCCNNEDISAPFIMSMYLFLSVMYYFGLIKLPSKTDYWDSKHIILKKESRKY